MKITTDDLVALYGCTYDRAGKFVSWLNEYMQKYGIDTPARICAFLAQVGHESGRLRYVEEIATGAAYEGQKDLGNIHPGDGRRFKGRGLIQVTGRANYTEISRDTGIDFVKNPTLLAEPEYAVLSACWFWKKRNLNQYADTGNFLTLTKKINGGYNGLEDREVLYAKAKSIFKVTTLF